jgi:two-component system, chemotaxis family, sensor kinase CheA
MSDYLDPNNEELLKDFFIEAQTQVDTLEQNILVLENDPGNHDAIDEIFRAAHTLKGGSATVEMAELTEFTHLVEDVLDCIRSGTARATEAVVDVLLQSVDVVKAMLASRSEGAVYHGDTSGVTSTLRSFIPEGTGKAKHAPAPKLADVQSAPKEAPKPVTLGKLSEYELLELKESADPSKSIYQVTVHFNEDTVMNTVGGIQAFAMLKELGTVLRTTPDFESLYEDNFFPEVEYYLATDRDEAAILKRVSIPDVVLRAEAIVVSSGMATQAAPKPQAPKPAPAKAPVVQPNVVPAAKVPATPAASSAAPEEAAAPEEHGFASDREKDEAKKAAQQAGSILRVDSKRIDNLLNLVSETVITKATFNQISTQFTELQAALASSENQYREQLKSLFDSMPDYLESIQGGRSVKEIKKEITEKYGDVFNQFDEFDASLKTAVAKFRSTAQNLGRITGELQEGVMRIRMVPISQIFSRFPRLVRDLSKTLNKKINLVIEGEDTELDKSVIEDLLDPLMHSVRNALDHGVETPEERIAAGKPETGTVLLRASNEGNMILIEIADDGKGIDVEAVRTKAIERGLIHPNKTLTDIEAFNLIFEAGFSTAKTVTNISGRGVGLDVVRTQIEKLNGSVTVSSQHGRGSRFTIKLPLTLAIIQGLLVRVGREIYSIPITSVIESHRIRPSEIKMIDNYEVFNVRNDVISLLRLDRLFKIQTTENREYNFVVIVGTNEKRVGLMVDSLIGEEDVVIKPLRDQYTNSPGIAGASILGDGSVSLIIDVSQLLDLGFKRELEERRKREATIR